MAAVAVTYTFSNSTTADATQVNQNFTDIINGLSDGSKDISVNAVTAAGNLSVSGNTTLGNATADDITVTGSLASSIPIKTTNTYDFGSSTLGLRALYFGANSQTVNIKGSSTMSATWTMTLPVTAGTANYFLQTNGSGVTSWAQVQQTSEILVTGGSGHGSVGTCIRRYTTSAISTGSDITYTADSTNGDKFVINTAGMYCATYCDIRASTGQLGISKNASSLTTSIGSLGFPETLVYNFMAGGFPGSVSVSFHAAVNDIIRGHDAGGSDGTSAFEVAFRIVRLC